MSHNIFASVSAGFIRAFRAALCISHNASGFHTMIRHDVLDPSGYNDYVLVLI